jgi:hypothetical protein
MLAALALIVGLAFLAPMEAGAQSKQDFSLVNKTGYTIDKLFVSPTHSDDWQNDILGRGVLEDGDKVDITFSREAKTCNWDLKVVYTDNDTAVWTNIDLCSVSKITIRWNKSSGETRATFD